MYIFASYLASSSIWNSVSSADRSTYFRDTLIQYVLLFGAFAVTIIASAYVNSTAKKYSKVMVSNGRTGAQVAYGILRGNGLNNVPVSQGSGNLSDHYDPRTRSVVLSADVYGRSTITAVAVAAHECGHALQHAQGYGPLKLRTSMAPVVSVASTFSWILIIIGLIFALTPFTFIGVIFFIAVVVFQLITLPVEFNASSRALAILNNSGTMTSEEMKGAKKVLTAAAMTYVAALAASVMTLIRLILLTRRR